MAERFVTVDSVTRLFPKPVMDALRVALGSTTPTPTPTRAPSITTSSLNAMTQGVAFEQQLLADGDADITWTLVSGGVPGLVLSSAGKYSGQPSSAGTYTPRVRATNAAGTTDRIFTVTVAQPPVVSTWSTYTSDSFAGPDTSDINGRTTDLAPDGGTSKQWVASGYGITANALTAVGTGTGSAFVPLVSAAAEMAVVVGTMPNATIDAHLFAMELGRTAVSASGVSTYRLRMYGTGNLAITRILNGTETVDNLAISEASSFKAGDIVTFRRVYNADRTIAYLSVRVNDAEVADFVDRSPLPVGSYAGFYRDGRTGSFDAVAIRTQATTISAPTIDTSSLSFVQGSPTSQKIVVNGDPTIVVTSISGKPAGLTLADNGDVTGIPTGTGSSSWVVRATNAGGFVDKTIAVTITAQGGSSGGGFVFGAEGRYWPDATPSMVDVMDRTIEIDPTWTAMAAGINKLLAETPSTAKTKILVRPGKLPLGFSAGAAAQGVLQNIGSADRTWNIIITPRDGLGTVTGTVGTGCAFQNVAGISIIGIDFTDISLVMSNPTRMFISHTFADTGNIQARGAGGAKDSAYVECVFGPKDIVTNGDDRCAMRTSGGFTALNSGWVGCYMAPSQRRLGQTGHCDTIQLSASGNSPDIRARIIGNSIWSSANQAIAYTETPHAQQINMEKNLVIAGMSRVGKRYTQEPRDEGGAKLTELYQTTGENCVIGGGVDITSKDNIFIGTVSNNHTWKSVVNTKVSEAQANPQGTGDFTVDTSLANVTKAQLDAWSPYPTPARQRDLWNRQFTLASV